MTLSTNFPWHKQLDFSVYCGYYMCEHLRVQGRYTTDLERDNSSRNKGQLHGFSDLCHFIMHEVINPMATFYSKEHELATDSIYLGLCEWENKKHRVSSSSVGLQDRQVRSAIVQRHRCTVVSAWARLQAGGGGWWTAEVTSGVWVARRRSTRLGRNPLDRMAHETMESSCPMPQSESRDARR